MASSPLVVVSDLGAKRALSDLAKRCLPSASLSDGRQTIVSTSWLIVESEMFKLSCVQSTKLLVTMLTFSR